MFGRTSDPQPEFTLSTTQHPPFATYNWGVDPNSDLTSLVKEFGSPGPGAVEAPPKLDWYDFIKTAFKGVSDELSRRAAVDLARAQAQGKRQYIPKGAAVAYGKNKSKSMLWWVIAGAVGLVGLTAYLAYSSGNRKKGRRR